MDSFQSSFQKSSLQVANKVTVTVGFEETFNLLFRRVLCKGKEMEYMADVFIDFQSSFQKSSLQVKSPTTNFSVYVYIFQSSFQKSSLQVKLQKLVEEANR